MWGKIAFFPKKICTRKKKIVLLHRQATKTYRTNNNNTAK